MKVTLETVVVDALKLPLSDRAALAQALIRSLDEAPAADTLEIERAWAEEVERRVDEIMSGRAQGIPAEQVFTKSRAQQG